MLRPTRQINPMVKGIVMKSFLKQLLVLSAMAAFSVVTPVVSAQVPDSAENKSQQDTAQSSAQQADNAESKLQQISTQLNLSEEQKTKLKPILQDEVDQLKALKSDTATSSQEKLQKAKEIRASHKQQIDAILTPEQKEKWQQMRQQAVEPMKQNTAPQPKPQ
jgi:periplasmic protein CpxP/Spy